MKLHESICNYSSELYNYAKEIGRTIMKKHSIKGKYLMFFSQSFICVRNTKRLKQRL